MRAMRRFRLVRTAFVGLAAIAVFGQDAGSNPDAKVSRGKYLAEEVARCQDCHTPKMDNGSYIKSQWMKGATISLMPAAPIPGWRTAAPDITPAGAIWKRWGDDGLTAF